MKIMIERKKYKIDIKKIEMDLYIVKRRNFRFGALIIDSVRNRVELKIDELHGKSDSASDAYLEFVFVNKKKHKKNKTKEKDTIELIYKDQTLQDESFHKTFRYIYSLL